jgi:hypothetical protein
MSGTIILFKYNVHFWLKINKKRKKKEKKEKEEERITFESSSLFTMNAAMQINT